MTLVVHDRCDLSQWLFDPGEPPLPVWRRPRMAGFKSEVPRRSPLGSPRRGRCARRALKEPPLQAGRDLPQRQKADRLAHRNGVCVEQIVPNAVALLLAKCRAHALGRSDASLLMQSPCRSSPRTSSSPSGGVDASMATGRKCRGRISMASAQRVGFSAPWRVRRWWWDRRPWGEGADQPRQRVG